MAREIIIKFRVSVIESILIKKSADACSMTLSNYVRSSALSVQIRSRLSMAEIEVYTTLTEFSENFRRIETYLDKSGDVFNLKKDVLEARDAIQKHLRKL